MVVCYIILCINTIIKNYHGYHGLFTSNEKKYFSVIDSKRDNFQFECTVLKFICFFLANLVI